MSDNQALVDEARQQIAREVLLNEYREEPELVDRLEAEPACQGWKSALATADRIIAIVAEVHAKLRGGKWELSL